MQKKGILNVQLALHQLNPVGNLADLLRKWPLKIVWRDDDDEKRNESGGCGGVGVCGANVWCVCCRCACVNDDERCDRGCGCEFCAEVVVVVLVDDVDDDAGDVVDQVDEKCECDDGDGC